MRSPNGNELRDLAGSPSAIWSRGQNWFDLGNQMDDTAARLTEIGDSSVHRSKGTEKLGELAADTAVDLKAAAVRYRDTGKALRVYGDALEVAQNWLRSNKDDVERAENEYQRLEREQPVEWMSPYRDDNLIICMGDDRRVGPVSPPDGQATAAGCAMSRSAELDMAERHRTEMWNAFDDMFETWSDAYDDAVDSIEKAYDTAGNNDGFWEAVDAVLDVLAVVIIVLTVVALVIGAPLTGLLGAVIFALSAAVLALNLLKFAFGRATLGDVAMAAIGLLPFGIGKILNRGVPALSAVVKAGRGSIVSTIRGGLKPVFTKFWKIPVFHPFRAIGNAWTWLRAPSVARGALPRPGMFTNPLTAMRLGGAETAQVNTFLQTMRESGWATSPAVQQMIADTAGHMPGVVRQFGNLATWLGSTGFSVVTTFGWKPQIPFLSDVRIG